MSPPRRPQGPRPPGSAPGSSAGTGQGPRSGPGARSAPGQTPRPRAFDGKRGWTGGEAPEGRGGPSRPPFAKPGAPAAGPAGRPFSNPNVKSGVKPWAKPPGKAWARPPAEARQGQPEAEPGRGPRQAGGDFPSRGRPDAVRREAAQQQAQSEDRAPANTFWMHGLHAVGAALLNPRRRLRRLLLTADAEETLTARLPPGTFAARKLTVERVEDRIRFHSFLPEDSVHQGAAMLVEPLPGQALEDLLEGTSGPILLLDQVTDPRNVGAILRSAAAFGAAAVVVQDRHAPPETGALARAASGALEKVPMVREVNLARAIRSLQDRGFWVLGLAGEAKRTLAEAKPTDRRVALVLGAEAGGLRRLQRDTVDEMVRLPIGEAMESLNVAAATAVALYELGRA